MKLEQQVCGLELSKKLKELEVKQESLHYWTNAYYEPRAECWDVEVNFHLVDEMPYSCADKRSSWYINWKKHFKVYSAFTVAELGEMLPKEFVTFDTEDEWIAFDIKDIEIGHRCGGSRKTKKVKELILPYTEITFNNKIEADTEANARAKMLIYLIENNLCK